MASTIQPPSTLFGGQQSGRMPRDSGLGGRSTPGGGTESPGPQRKRATPRHPIPSMQDAFDESLAEHTNGTATLKPQLRFGDAKARRDVLLEQGKDDPPPATTWRYRPGQKNHELRRLLAQISFGVHLLLNGSATAVESVVKILQGHIDEVDEFLETTLEDFAVATEDLQERLGHLQLPMNNIAVFERMLEDRQYRLQILDGNEAIEHVTSRTTAALMQTVEDVNEGLRATRQFTVYLTEQQHGKWKQEQPDVINIFEAMKGNADGWVNAFAQLQTKGSALHTLVVELTGVVSEMELKAGEVSRRTRFTIEPFTAPVKSPRSSQGSMSTARAESPPRSRIPSSPPRLSLRLSTILPPQGSELSFFDLPSKRDTLIPQSPRKKEPDIQEEPEPTEIAPPETQSLEISPPDMPPPAIEIPAIETPVIETPVIETPVIETPVDEPNVTEQPDIEPLEPEQLEIEIKMEEDSLRRALGGTASPTDKPVNSNKEDEASELYILLPRAYTPLPPAPLPSPRVRDPSPEPISERIEVELEPQRESQRESCQEPPRESMMQKRTSLRQRISLKTTPPESIQVPPPNAPELRQSGYVAPQIYQGPDSAYGSDMERQAANSTVPSDPSTADLTGPAFRRPGLIPSPHSDQQHFRPVLASPHSPLQQRPHTSHSLRPGQFPPNQRNVPSAMGMSTLSNVTNMNNENSQGQKLKKKRSAFGWLRKAFTLDEEERAVFEQRKQLPPLPPAGHDHQSPKFLDGRRIK